VIIMKHEKRRFIDRVDYITSPGWIDGPGGRAGVGLPPDKGPRVVVTNLGIMKFDAETKRMYLAEYFPGVTVKDVQGHTGFDMDMTRAKESLPPEKEVLRVLLEKVDPQRLII